MNTKGHLLFLVMILSKYVLIGTIIHCPHISPKQSKINYLLGDVDKAKYLPIILLFPLVFFHGLLISHTYVRLHPK